MSRSRESLLGLEGTRGALEETWLQMMGLFGKTLCLASLVKCSTFLAASAIPFILNRIDKLFLLYLRNPQKAFKEFASGKVRSNLIAKKL